MVTNIRTTLGLIEYRRNWGFVAVLCSVVGPAICNKAESVNKVTTTIWSSRNNVDPTAGDTSGFGLP